MRFWIRLDGEGAGGFDDLGLYIRHEVVERILDANWPEVEAWFRCYRVDVKPGRGYAYRFPLPLSLGALLEPDVRHVARHLLRCFGAGRAAAHVEAKQTDDE